MAKRKGRKAQILADGRKKSETTQERRLVVYLPSHKMRTDLEEAAAKVGAKSVSQYAVVALQDALGQEPVPAGTVQTLRDEVQRLTEIIDEKEARLRHYKRAFSQQEKELELFRAQSFLEPDFSGIRSFSSRLVELLKTEEFVPYESLLRQLDIDPEDTLMVKGIRKQLELLEGMGVVTSDPEGWRWKS